MKSLCYEVNLKIQYFIDIQVSWKGCIWYSILLPTSCLLTLWMVYAINEYFHVYFYGNSKLNTNEGQKGFISLLCFMTTVLILSLCLSMNSILSSLRYGTICWYISFKPWTYVFITTLGVSKEQKINTSRPIISNSSRSLNDAYMYRKSWESSYLQDVASQIEPYRDELRSNLMYVSINSVSYELCKRMTPCLLWLCFCARLTLPISPRVPTLVIRI